jgi:hypothetical protein
MGITHSVEDDDNVNSEVIEKIYRTVKSGNLSVSQQISKCINYLQKKPWDTNKIQHILIANATEDVEDSTFFDTPFDISGIQCKNKKFNTYKWYIPSSKLFDFLCLLDYDQEDSFTCNIQKNIRTFTDSDGNQYSFVFAIVYQDNTCKLLNKKDYIQECRWWDDDYNIVKLAGIEGTSEGKVVRQMIKKNIQRALSSLHSDLNDINEDNKLVQAIEQAFLNKIKREGKSNIYQYVHDILFFIIFIDKESPLYPYTQSLREKLVSDQFRVSYIPEMTINDMIPQSEGEQLKELVESYLSYSIELFFNKIADRIHYNHREVQPFVNKYETEDIKEKLKEYCMIHDFDSETAEGQIVSYKDEEDRIYCFTINQVLDAIFSATSDQDVRNPVDKKSYLDKKFI